MIRSIIINTVNYNGTKLITKYKMSYINTIDDVKLKYRHVGLWIIVIQIKCLIF